MTEGSFITKTALLDQILHEWDRLNQYLDSLSAYQLTEIKNADGWTVKDHIAHLTAWEESVIAFLTGKPRHEGLGIPETVYLSEDIDAMNQVILENRRDESLTHVRSQFQATHTRTLELLNQLTDTDLSRPYSDYLPDEPGEYSATQAIMVILGNTAEHYEEHFPWIAQMLSDS